MVRVVDNRKGFTLLELIVVMALAAMVVSFAFPNIAGFLATDQLNVSARRLTGLIGQASLLAQRRQAAYLLRYVESEHRFVVEPEQPPDDYEPGRNEGELRLASTVSVGGLWSLYGETGSANEVVIRFTKNGYVEPTVLYLRSASGREISVVLSPFLGKIQVLSGYVEPQSTKMFQ